jgi:hypothetical protein
MRKLIQLLFLAAALTAIPGVLLYAATVCEDDASVVARPIALGVPGANINMIQTDSQGNISGCCTGTLGALVKGPGGEYILSNNHVLGRVNLAAPGEGIIQPGCPASSSAAQDDIVAHLSQSAKINFGAHARNKIDAAIAQVVSGDVSGDILNIGPISNKIAPAVVNLAVQKMGAASCLTNGTIKTFNFSTAKISYPSQCDSDSGTANFVNQIVVKGSSGTFAVEGDSGSLVVTADSCPRPVGLVFASDSNGDIFVNPIKQVLSHFGVSIVAGCTASTTLADSDAEGGGAVSGGASAGIDASDDSAAQEAAAFAKISGMTMDAVNLAIAAKTRHEKDLFAIAQVAGVGVGASGEPGVPSIDVYVTEDSPALRAALPDTLEGLPVNVIVSGRIHAL